MGGGGGRSGPTERNPGIYEGTGEDAYPVMGEGGRAGKLFHRRRHLGHAPKEKQAERIKTLGKVTHLVQAVFPHCLFIKFLWIVPK